MTKPSVVLGTRAEVLKMIPVLRALDNYHIEYRLILTGQNEVESLLDKFKVKTDSLVVLKSFKNVGLDLIKGLRALPKLIAELRQTLGVFDSRYVMFHGDTATAFATSLALKQSKQFGLHVEAGLRSHHFAEPVPEELFRRTADHKSHILFVPSIRAKENLLHESVKGQIVLCGNPVYDLVNMAMPDFEARVRFEPFVLFTMHRYENIQVKSRMKRILNIVQLCKLPVLWPVHEMTLNSLRRFGMLSFVRKIGVELLPLLDYPQFLDLLSRCKCVITDGGTIEEESLILGKPCMLLRKRTERGEGLAIGLTYLTRLNVEYSKQVIQNLENCEYKPSKRQNPYFFGTSPSKLIASWLSKTLKLNDSILS